MNNIKYPKSSIYDLLSDSCKKYSNKTAIIYNGDKIKYKDLLNNIDECANSFVKIGISNKDTITLVVENSIEFLICMYAINKIGAICNMIYSLSSEEEIKKSYIVSNSKCLIIPSNLIVKIKNIKNRINVDKIIYINKYEMLSTLDKIKYIFNNPKDIIDNDFISYNRLLAKGKYKNIKLSNNINKKDIAFIIKSGLNNILLTNLNINSSAINFNSYNNLLENKLYLFDYSISDGFGIVSIHKAILSGSTIILIPNLTPRTMSNYILKYKPNIIECSTNTLNLIINNKKFNSKNLSYLDLIICSKEKLNNSLKDKIIEFLDKHNSSAVLKSTFGMKESTSNIAITDENTSDSIGKPYPNVNINIFNNEKECKPLEIGEICINGPIVMDSYLNDIKSDKFLKKHKNNTIWLHSGDLGYKDSNGFIYFKSSIKRVIISNDNDIYPSDIENIILAHPYVKGCSIVGVPHPYKKEVVKAYIVLKDGLILNSEIKKSIKEYCEKNIAEYALPYAYAYRKELPKTISGKVSYQKLVSDKDEEE